LRKLLALALTLASVVACTELDSSIGSPNSGADGDERFGEIGYGDFYRCYDGPSAISKENDVHPHDHQRVGKAPTRPTMPGTSTHHYVFVGAESAGAVVMSQRTEKRCTSHPAARSRYSGLEFF
jgi:hypothetical protein